MTGPVHRFLRFLSVLEGRNRHQIAIALNCSRATVDRLLQEARQSGVQVQAKHEQRESCRYVVTDPGPFDLKKLQQLPWRTMGRKG